MLEDYIDDLLKDLRASRENEVAKLIATDSNSRHELIRGRIAATDDAIALADRLRKSYLREAA